MIKEIFPFHFESTSKHSGAEIARAHAKNIERISGAKTNITFPYKTNKNKGKIEVYSDNENSMKKAMNHHREIVKSTQSYSQNTNEIKNQIVQNYKDNHVSESHISGFKELLERVLNENLKSNDS